MTHATSEVCTVYHPRHLTAFEELHTSRGQNTYILLSYLKLQADEHTLYTTGYGILHDKMGFRKENDVPTIFS